MATLEIKDAKGKVVGKHEVAGQISEAAPLMSVIHRAVIAEQSNGRQGTQSAKTRAETRGGGRKPYKQKKTGNARQGTIRAPHYAHGGMAFAVKPRSYAKKINKKERRGAIAGALNAQVTAGNVILTDKVFFAAPKTKDATSFLAALGLDAVKRVLIILPQYDEVVLKSFRNLPNVVIRTAPVRGSNVAEEVEEDAKPKKTSKKAAAAAEPVKTSAFSARDLLVARKIVIAKDAMAMIEQAWS